MIEWKVVLVKTVPNNFVQCVSFLRRVKLYKILSILIFLLATINISADDSLEDYSDTINPLLDEIIVFHQDDEVRYRALIFRGGYEHVSAFIVIQKFSVNHNGQANPYKLTSSLTIDEINKVYNFGIKHIVKNESDFIITFNATHSHLYKKTEIELKLSESMNYEIISGLVNF